MNDDKNRDIRNIGKSTFPSFKIGKNSNVGWDCVVDTSGGVIIGDNVEIARRTIIYTHDHNIHSLKWKDGEPTYCGLRVRNNAFVGAGCIILPQVKTIGFGAIIGAGSVLTKDVPDLEVWAGNPARKIGDRKWEQDT